MRFSRVELESLEFDYYSATAQIIRKKKSYSLTKRKSFYSFFV